MRALRLFALTAAALAVAPRLALADDLYRRDGWAAMSTDRRATSVGDALTVLIFQASESVNSAQTSTRRGTDLGGGVRAGSLNENAELSFGGGFTGRGETRRSERFAAQITVTVREVLPNGDLVVGGEQLLLVNGERTRIGVRGRVRAADISAENVVPSSRIADAQIDYGGRGFVSRSARPGLINRIFRFLGLS
jgi:flagellar L-ring protein precursor FlgH